MVLKPDLNSVNFANIENSVNFVLILNQQNQLDLEYVRSQFPGLNNGWTYFDNAGGSQILTGVVERLNDFLYKRNVQTGGSYETSLKTSAAVLEGRSAMAQFINADRPEEIVFAPSSTVALNNLAEAISHQLKPGDEIIVTVSDHESNIGPWVRLEKRGVIVKFWELNKDSFELEIEELESLISERTRLVAVTHVSNIIGTINPIKEIARIVHSHGALICVDSVAFAPHRLIDVRDLDVDFLVFSTYKVYGPHFAVLYGKYELLLELENLYHYFHGKDEVPRKLEPGNPSYELAYSVAGIVEYFEEIGSGLTVESGKREKLEAAFEAVAIHEAGLSETLLSNLRFRNDCKIIGLESGTDYRRVPTISFFIKDKNPDQIARSVEKYNLAIRFGDFYARRLVDYLGYGDQNGVVRVSAVHYNTIGEVESLVEAFEKELN